jgi:hypothetical protein
VRAGDITEGGTVDPRQVETTLKDLDGIFLAIGGSQAPARQLVHEVYPLNRSGSRTESFRAAFRQLYDWAGAVGENADELIGSVRKTTA